MDIKLQASYRQLVERLERKFGEGLELDAILMIVGVQEVGLGNRKYSKDEKMHLMHVAICTILEPYGFYKFLENDKDGWPHFEKQSTIPSLSSSEQEVLLKEALVNYFEVNRMLD